MPQNYIKFKPSASMVKLFSFEWLMMLIYAFAKLSGFLFISIDFTSFPRYVMWKCWTYTLISFGLSVYSTTFDSQFSVAHVSHSKMMQKGQNAIIMTTIWFPLVFKFIFFPQGQRFFYVLLSFQWINEKVKSNRTLPRT